MSKLKDAWELVANACLRAGPVAGHSIPGVKVDKLIVPMSPGLCGIISSLYETYEISEKMADGMKDQIRSIKPHKLYKWPFTVEGWRQRYWFCKRQAAKCK